MTIYTAFTPGPIRRIEASSLEEAQAKAEAGFEIAKNRRGYSHRWLEAPDRDRPTWIFQVLDTKGRTSTGCTLVAGEPQNRRAVR